MHNLILVGLAVLLGGALVIVTNDSVAAVLRSDGLRSHGVVFAVAGLIGLFAALWIIQASVDLVPDDIEEALSPVAAVVVSAALAIMGWQRYVRRH